MRDQWVGLATARMCDGVATALHRFPAHSLSLSRDYLSSQICNLDFVEEGGQRFTIFGILGVQKLDGDSSTDAGHMAFIDDAHAPLTELPHDLIPTKRGSHHSRSPLSGTRTLLFHEPLQTHPFACRRWPVQVCHNVCLVRGSMEDNFSILIAGNQAHRMKDQLLDNLNNLVLRSMHNRAQEAWLNPLRP